MKAGEDIIENAIAVCPNCHQKAYYGYINGSILIMHKLANLSFVSG